MQDRGMQRRPLSCQNLLNDVGPFDAGQLCTESRSDSAVGIASHQIGSLCISVITRGRSHIVQPRCCVAEGLQTDVGFVHQGEEQAAELTVGLAGVVEGAATFQLAAGAA